MAQTSVMFSIRAPPFSSSSITSGIETLRWASAWLPPLTRSGKAMAIGLVGTGEGRERLHPAGIGQRRAGRLDRVHLGRVAVGLAVADDGGAVRQLHRHLAVAVVQPNLLHSAPPSLEQVTFESA